MRKTKANYTVTTALLNCARDAMDSRGGRMAKVDVLSYIHNYHEAH